LQNKLLIIDKIRDYLALPTSCCGTQSGGTLTTTDINLLQ